MLRSRYLCLCVALSAAGCNVQVGDKGMSVGVASETASEEWMRSYALPPGGRLEVASFNGPLEVTGTTDGQVEVKISRQATAMTKQAAADALASSTIVEDAAADHVSIAIRPKDGATGMRQRQATTTISVKLPRGLTAAVRSQNGQIRLDNVDGTVTAAVTNGAITGRQLAGSLSASVVNGRLSVDMASIAGAVEVSAMNGSIGLGLPPDLKADLDATALNGGVTVDPQLKLQAEAAPAGDGRAAGAFFTNRVTGRLNGGGPKITAQVTNGGVRIGLPGNEPEPRRNR